MAASLVFAAQPAPGAADEWFPLRLPEQAMRNAVLDAIGRSATFEQLVAALRQRDAIVYVRWNPVLPRRLRAAVILRVVVTPEARYLWMNLKPDRVSDQLIAVIAHEIRHVLEILDAGVSEPVAIAGLYARSSGRTGARVYETRAALEAGEQVQRELKADRSTRTANNQANRSPVP